MPKYGIRKTRTTDSEIHEDLLERRDVNFIEHFDPFEFSKKITRSYYAIREHVWSKGDRLFKLSSKYYGTSEYWWIIALWNGKPTDIQYEYGAVVQIPFPPRKIYRTLVEDY